MAHAEFYVKLFRIFDKESIVETSKIKQTKMQRPFLVIFQYHLYIFVWIRNF